MFKKIFIASLLLALGSTAVSAQDAKTGQGISEWLTSLQKKMAKITPRKTVPVSNAVAGVRGANEACVAKLYWKSKACDDFVTEEELARFKAAVELAAKGDREAAIKELESFLAQYPDSDLIPDAVTTLRVVKADAPQTEAAPPARDAETVPTP